MALVFHFSDDDTDYKRLFDHGKHLSKEDKEALLGSGAIDDEDSNLSFEREMENEARNHINGVHVNSPPVPVAANPSGSSLTAVEQVPVASTSKTREQQNDELFYDPEEDQRDQEWLDSHRAKHSAISSSISSTKERQKSLRESSKLKTPQSDATLNCPCCLTLLCLDCQRHDVYKTQYRAMFVSNCRVEFSKKLLYRNKEEHKKSFKWSKKRRTADKPSDPNGDDQPSESDLYFAVHCLTCNTQVGLYDTEEVYHFFSVLASH